MVREFHPPCCQSTLSIRTACNEDVVGGRPTSGSPRHAPDGVLAPHTLPVAITCLGSNSHGGWPQIAAGSVLSIMPIVVICLVAQRCFIAGLTGGAVDG